MQNGQIKVVILIYIIQEFVLKSFQGNKPRQIHIGIAEAKVFMIVCYYVILGSVGLSTYTYFITTDDDTAEAFQHYFMCQSVGVVPGLDCGDLPNVRLQEFGKLASVAATLIGLSPLVSLIFVVRLSCSRKYFTARTFQSSKTMFQVM